MLAHLKMSLYAEFVWLHCCFSQHSNASSSTLLHTLQIFAIFVYFALVPSHALGASTSRAPTLFTSLKLGSNEIWISIKSHCPLLTPELNILSSISAMHVQQKCMLHTAVLPWQIWNCAVRNTKWLLAANPCYELAEIQWINRVGMSGQIGCATKSAPATT